MTRIHNFLAFDLGATSGRAILGTLEGEKLSLEEVYRFPNSILEEGGKYYWDYPALCSHLEEALSKVGSMHVRIDSIGIDTWGVDFGLIGEDSLLCNPRSYRDPYTRGIPEEVFGIIPSGELYGRVGLQVMDFNSIFQLYAIKKEGVDFSKVRKILFMPDLLVRFLTGKEVCEYTIASTSGLVNQGTRSFDDSLLQRLGIKDSILPKMVQAGTVVGCLDSERFGKYGLGAVPVVAVAEHDTASAIAAVPADNEKFAYLSSGTWSLMGLELPGPNLSEEAMRQNFTNEGGIDGTTRFLKNITGMWILEQCRKVWKGRGKTFSYDEMVRMAEASSYGCLIDPDDPSFASPTDMVAAINAFLSEKGCPLPGNEGDYIRCIYHSLANRYREVLSALDGFAPFKIDTLHVIGGGAANDYMSQLTADAVGGKVVAGPVEATAIGNIMLQAKAAGLVSDRRQMRKIIAKAFSVKTFLPQNNH